MKCKKCKSTNCVPVDKGVEFNYLQIEENVCLKCGQVWDEDGKIIHKGIKL